LQNNITYQAAFYVMIKLDREEAETLFEKGARLLLGAHMYGNFFRYYHY
jgi:hypothetical protein